MAKPLADIRLLTADYNRPLVHSIATCLKQILLYEYNNPEETLDFRYSNLPEVYGPGNNDTFLTKYREGLPPNLRVGNGNITAREVIALREDIERFFELDNPFCDVEETRFNNREFNPRVLGDVRDKDVYLFMLSAGHKRSDRYPEGDLRAAFDFDYDPSVAYTRLGFLHEGLNDASVGGIIDMYGEVYFDRQDKKHKTREPISLRKMGERSRDPRVNESITLDPHSESVRGYFDRLSIFSAAPIFAYLLEKRLEALGIPKEEFPHRVSPASPDDGGVRRAKEFTDYMLIPRGNLVIALKERPAAGLIAEDRTIVIGNPKEVTAAIDDKIDTGGTQRNAMRAFSNAGAKHVYAMATHPLLSKGAVEGFREANRTYGLQVMCGDTTILRPDEFYQANFDWLQRVYLAPLWATIIRNAQSGISSLTLTKRPFIDRLYSQLCPPETLVA
ncbi:MAG: hypothetical protein HY831_05265 [Candidatus Aenigmarchaeota archaeon]|nr:hypothetical protein [Candidatus Aenigmarchaeota archaeon]